METVAPRVYRGRGGLPGDSTVGRGRPLSRNKQWTASEASSRGSTPGHSDGERWERGGYHGRGRGTRGITRGGHRKFLNATLRNPTASRGIPAAPSTEPEGQHHGVAESQPEPEEDSNDEFPEIDEPVLEAQEEREKFYQELVKAREVERKKAITEGKMDDPLVPKRLEDAISIVGTCTDMCPRFERYRRERENNLFEWETIPGTKRVDHNRAVKMYERAAGDKTLPSDLRPPHVLKRTLNYLFHDLLQRGGLQRTANFIRDRSRAVRNDLTMQHLTGRLAIECHDRCARFHILVMHFERDRPGFSLPMEEQQLMNTLQSLKEFYEDQRGKYQSPTELEMRMYHRLIHIRDQKERHEDIPEYIISHPVFKLTTDFRLHVQKKSAPITKTSTLVVDVEAMQIFGKLAAVLREQGSTVMIYLVACILERLFGKETIDDIEAIRGDLSIPDIIDGRSGPVEVNRIFEEGSDGEMQDEMQDEVEEAPYQEPASGPGALQPSATEWLSTNFNSQNPASVFHSTATPAPALAPTPASAFATITSTPNVFGTLNFGIPSSTPASTSTSIFGNVHAQTTPFVINQPQALSSNLAQTPTEVKVPVEATVEEEYLSTTHSPPAPKFPSFFRNSALPNISTTPPIPQSSLFSGFSNTSASSSFKPPTINGSPFSAPTQSQLNSTAPAFTPSTSPSFFPIRRSPESSANADSVPTVAKTKPTPPPPFTSSITPPIISRNRSSSSSSPLALKIDTNTSSIFNAPAVASPREPPHLSKKQPISLPSTPTTNIAPPSALLTHIKSGLNTPTPSSNPGFLSPLVFQSPSTSSMPTLNNFSPRGTPRDKIGKPSLFASANGKGKAPAIDSPSHEPSSEMLAGMEKNTYAFEHRGHVVKESFRRWLKLTTDKAAWIEACRQSDAYRQKNRQQQNGTPDKKRRISTAASVPTEAPKPKRARRRISSNYQSPRTDDELARRFKENHEEHERRWAPGSFLQVFKTFFRDQRGVSPLPAPWQAWVSMNPESDATAIWLERKFDVPNSGNWASEMVFSIPISSGKTAQTQGHPGVIAFECTPIEGIDDDIERKYRILDDCTRLREIIKSLPPRRPFTPSLLILCWSNGEKPYSAPDFFDMVSKLVQESTIRSYHIMHLSATEKNLDEKLDSSLKALAPDLEGELVRPLTIRGVYKHFLPVLTAFVTEWIDSCVNRVYFNWKLYGLLVDASILLLNSVTQRVCQLAEVRGSATLPSFRENSLGDSNSAYEAAEQWLRETSLQIDTSHILLDLHSHQDIDQDFPARVFLDHIIELVQTCLERLFGAKENRYIMVADLATSQKAFEASLQSYRVQLSQRLNATVRRSPKRRSYSIDTSEPSPEPKRARLSTADSSVNGNSSPFTSPVPNGRHTPSPSNSTVSLAPSDAPVVTVAMLRALTRDIKKKYAQNS